VTGPELAQTIANAGATPQSIAINPQGPNAGSTGAGPGTPGGVVITLAAPVDVGVEAYVQVLRASTIIGSIGANAAFGAIWLGNAAPTATNYTVWGFSGDTYINGATSIRFRPANAPGTVGAVTTAGWQFGSETAQFGGGAGVLGLSNAQVDPTTNPSVATIIYSSNTTGVLKARSSAGVVSSLNPNNTKTVNSQAQVLDRILGTAETVSSATPTAIVTYATATGTGGILTLDAVSRATTTGTGIAVGDTGVSKYVLGYKNVAGTVTLSTAGITQLGTGQTTAAALTAPVLTATVATNVITILVTNTNAATIDSEVFGSIVVC
jgi:hypothetical protein